MTRTLLRYFLLFISILLIAAIPRVDFFIDEVAEVSLLQEEDLDETIKRGLCIVLYVNTDQHDRNDWNMKSVFGTTTLQFVDQMLRETMAFKERISSSVKIYKANWKQWLANPDSKVHAAAGLSPQDAKGALFATYDVNGTVASRISGPLRPDAMTWLVHSIMEYYTHSIRTDKGDFLRQGWLITDTRLPFINLVNVRKGSITVNDRTEAVQINNYVSTLHEGSSYRYERIYATDGRLLGSIESYGPYGTFGYFDYDGTGKFQYRMRYLSFEGK
jgi:hypothetical protein